MGLRWRDVDIANGAIHVERACDPDARVFVEPKSRAGRRRVPVAGALRDALPDLRAGLDRVDPEELILGDRPGGPFSYEPMITRARAAWKRAELDSVGLHAARHTCASVMIAAGVNVKALSEFLGHASITITLDRYGDLLPGSIAEATTLLDAFLDRTAARTAARDGEPLQTGDS
jgi:integrase